MAEHGNERSSTSRQIPIKEDVKRIPVGTKTNKGRQLKNPVLLCKNPYKR